jgi:hypothetical protein
VIGVGIDRDDRQPPGVLRGVGDESVLADGDDDVVRSEHEHGQEVALDDLHVGPEPVELAAEDVNGLVVRRRLLLQRYVVGIDGVPASLARRRLRGAALLLSESKRRHRKLREAARCCSGAAAPRAAWGG